MSGRPALLVVLLLSVGRMAHQRSVVFADNDDDNSALKSDANSDASNTIKRHVGKFVRIGRSSPKDRSSLQSDDAVGPPSRYLPLVSRRALRYKRLPPDLHNTGDAEAFYGPWDETVVIGFQLGGLQDTDAGASAVDAVRLKLKKNQAVRFVRIGKTEERERQRTPSLRRMLQSDWLNMFKRSLENRFVRIGK